MASTQVSHVLRLVAPDGVSGPTRPLPIARRAPTLLRGSDPSAPATARLTLGGPSAAERARRLRAALDACGADARQRELLHEIIGHFRAWCEAHALGDPFAA
jgi:hypothetical protein